MNSGAAPRTPAVFSREVYIINRILKRWKRRDREGCWELLWLMVSEASCIFQHGVFSNFSVPPLSRYFHTRYYANYANCAYSNTSGHILT